MVQGFRRLPGPCVVRAAAAALVFPVAALANQSPPRLRRLFLAEWKVAPAAELRWRSITL